MSSDEEIYIAPPPNLFSRPSTSKCMPEVIVIDSDSDPESEPPKLAKKEEFTSRVLRSRHTKKPIPPLLPISLIKKKPKRPKPQPKTEVETVQPIKEEENSAEDAHISKYLVIKELKLRKGPLKLFVDIDPQLKGKWYLASLDSEAEAAGINVRPDSFLEGTGLLLWCKAEESTLVSAQGKMELTPPEVRCPHGLYICEMVDAVPRVRDKVLVNHIKNIEAIACCKLTLVLFGYKEYFRAACKRYPVVTGIDIETAIRDLRISTKRDAFIIDEPSELVMTVLTFNKGLTSLYKYEPMNAISENAEFFMKEFNRRCVPVDDDGVGLARLWQQMVSVLPLTSLESARAVCAKYKSLRSLYEALFTRRVLSRLLLSTRPGRYSQGDVLKNSARRWRRDLRLF
ncbi:uncharacterized protein LOC133319962 [Danaus plexippus]|uniref:uncharacterized protein LOC133319897 n=1 Tax=Danaus plexippus TaxID=13037 RepID=UPI002AAF0B74|nr:uncharacterized protein LOC133319897 [Danaus plexippus]XP_061382347.1 uncharacterized protein LOC133319962 [Danaus plexippus]